MLPQHLNVPVDGKRVGIAIGQDNMRYGMNLGAIGLVGIEARLDGVLKALLIAEQENRTGWQHIGGIGPIAAGRDDRADVHRQKRFAHAGIAHQQ